MRPKFNFNVQPDNCISTKRCWKVLGSTKNEFKKKNIIFGHLAGFGVMGRADNFSAPPHIYFLIILLYFYMYCSSLLISEQWCCDSTCTYARFRVGVCLWLIFSSFFYNLGVCLCLYMTILRKFEQRMTSLDFFKKVIIKRRAWTKYGVGGYLRHQQHLRLKMLLPLLLQLRFYEWQQTLQVNNNNNNNVSRHWKRGGHKRLIASKSINESRLLLWQFTSNEQVQSETNV